MLINYSHSKTVWHVNTKLNPGRCKCAKWKQTTAVCNNYVFTSQPDWLNYPEKRAIHLLKDMPRGQKWPWKICFSYRLRSSVCHVLMPLLVRIGISLCARPHDATSSHVNTLYLCFLAPERKCSLDAEKDKRVNNEGWKFKKVEFQRKVSSALYTCISKWTVSKLQHETSTTDQERRERCHISQAMTISQTDKRTQMPTGQSV